MRILKLSTLSLLLCFLLPPVHATAQCSLTLLSPAELHVLRVDDPFELRWESSGTCTSALRIELLRNGLVCRVIASSTENDGSYLWSPEQCGLLEGGYVMRIAEVGGSASYTTPFEFVILDPLVDCAVIVTEPSGDVDWPARSLQQIQWYSEGLCGSMVSIDLLHQDVVCRQLDASTENDGLFAWVAESCFHLESPYEIRITDLQSGDSGNSLGILSISPTNSQCDQNPSSELFLSYAPDGLIQGRPTGSGETFDIYLNARFPGVIKSWQAFLLIPEGFTILDQEILPATSFNIAQGNIPCCEYSVGTGSPVESNGALVNLVRLSVMAPTIVPDFYRFHILQTPEQPSGGERRPAFVSWVDDTVQVFDCWEDESIGEEGALSIDDDPSADLPNEILDTSLFGLYPNPFRENLLIRLPDALTPGASIKIYDTRGRLVSERQIAANAASTSVEWGGIDLQGRDLPSGVYFVKLQDELRSKILKVVKE